MNMPLINDNLAYLEKRLAQIQYPRYRAQGWPIGSGVVESENKLVVEARLRGGDALGPSKRESNAEFTQCRV